MLLLDNIHPPGHLISAFIIFVCELHTSYIFMEWVHFFKNSCSFTLGAHDFACLCSLSFWGIFSSVKTQVVLSLLPRHCQIWQTSAAIRWSHLLHCALFCTLLAHYKCVCNIKLYDSSTGKNSHNSSGRHPTLIHSHCLHFTVVDAVNLKKWNCLILSDLL